MKKFILFVFLLLNIEQITIAETVHDALRRLKEADSSAYKQEPTCFVIDLDKSTTDEEINTLVKDSYAQKYVTNIILHGNNITFAAIDQLSKLPHLVSIIKERWFITISRKQQNLIVNPPFSR